MSDPIEREYTVTWSIFIDAESPLEAADIAHGILNDPGNEAWVFVIYDEEAGKRTVVDMSGMIPRVIGGDDE